MKSPESLGCRVCGFSESWEQTRQTVHRLAIIHLTMGFRRTEQSLLRVEQKKASVLVHVF